MMGEHRKIVTRFEQRIGKFVDSQTGSVINIYRAKLKGLEQLVYYYYGQKRERIVIEYAEFRSKRFAKVKEI